jgi:hypothetical protein
MHGYLETLVCQFASPTIFSARPLVPGTLGYRIAGLSYAVGPLAARAVVRSPVFLRHRISFRGSTAEAEAARNPRVGNGQPPSTPSRSP